MQACRELWCWCGSRVPHHVRPRQEDRSLRIPLPRRERREGGRHVQRVIKALGRRDEVEVSGLIDGLIASAARHSRRSIVLSSFYRGELSELHRLSIGPDLVFGRLWAETGCRDVLKSLVADRRFSFDVERAVYLTVLHRLTISGSDRHANDWCSRVRVPGAEGFDRPRL